MTELRGFAKLDPEEHRKLASKAGKIAHETGKSYEFTSEDRSKGGRKGGLKVSQDKEHMRELAKKSHAKRKENQRKRMEELRKSTTEDITDKDENLLIQI